MTTEIKTVSLLDQLKASAAIYVNALGDIESMSDAELSTLFYNMDGGRLSDVVARLDDGGLSRVVALLDGGRLSDVVARLDDGGLSRVVALLDGGRLSRVVALLDDGGLSRVVALLDGGGLSRVVARLDGGRLSRVVALLDDGGLSRVVALLDDGGLSDVVARLDDGGLSRVVAKFKSLTETQVPIVADLDKRIAAAIGEGGCNLNMGSWHCGTTHCRAGWAITLAGEAGSELEAKFGPEMAGRLIYEASTGRPAPNFFARQEDALADIQRCAAL